MTAYEAFFRKKGVDVLFLTPSQWQSGIHRPDVEWVIMGHDRTPLGSAIRIHEYPSSSTPPFANWKNLAKRYVSVTPHFRIFLNKTVHDRMRFRDTIPFGYRDIGIYPPEPTTGETEKKIDFIYIGSSEKNRQLNRLLDAFTVSPMSAYTLLILSQHYEPLKYDYKTFPNISFEGPVSYGMVSQYLQQARYGINYMPDKAPFNEQTSTKLLEYIRAGLPVITTRYRWMEDFARKYGGSYFYMDERNPRFSLEELESFPFSAPDLSDWYWEKKINESGVIEFLQQHFPDLRT